MKKSWLLLICTIAAVLACESPGAAMAEAQQDPSGHLKFVLVLTRHGVRSPTWTSERLNEYSKDPWPAWDVAPGYLTPHGKKLMDLFGAYYRASSAERGLLGASGCADAKQVYIYADTDERTLETGRGIADGMLPGCQVEVHSMGEGVRDPLFHSAAKSGNADASLAFSALAGRMGGDPAALLPAYEMQLDRMQRVLFACPGDVCTVAGKKDLLGVTPFLAQGKSDHLVEMKGPLDTGATFAENFQLEYLEGMPEGSVGWGRLDEAQVRSLMAVHAAASDLLRRTPYLARVQASNLLAHMVRTLEQAEQQKPVAGAIGRPEDKVVFLVGHDTNITNVAAMLDAHWLVNGYQRDDTAPGGALVFEVWQRAGREDAVRAYYTVQSPAQMRNAVPLSLAAPPGKAMVFLPGCSRAGEGAPCNWSDFEHLAGTVIDTKFVQ